MRYCRCTFQVSSGLLRVPPKSEFDLLRILHSCYVLLILNSIQIPHKSKSVFQFTSPETFSNFFILTGNCALHNLKQPVNVETVIHKILKSCTGYHRLNMTDRIEKLILPASVQF